MNWGGVQVERVRFFALYRSLAFVVVRLLGLMTLVLSLIVLLAALIFEVPGTLIGFALVLLGPSIAICSFHIYATSIWIDSNLPIKPNDRSILNHFDHQSVAALLAYHRAGSRTAFWNELLKNPSIEGLMFRLGLSQKRLAELYLRANGSAEEFVQSVTERHPSSTQIDVFETAAVALADPLILDYFAKTSITQEAVAALTDFYARRYRSVTAVRFWDKWKVKNGGFAKLWATSYTSLLDRFTQEVDTGITKYVQFSPLFGRDQIVDQLVIELNKVEGQKEFLQAQGAKSYQQYMTKMP